jgi:putative ABC transport system permease protein
VLAGLVVGQVAAAIVLLTGAALLVRTVGELMAQDTGVEPERALVVKLPLGAGSTDRPAFVRGVLERVRALPGVQAAGLGTSLPPKGLPFQIFVAAPASGESARMSVVSATPGFLDALGVRPLSGRLFSQADQRPGEPVLILSESAARFAVSTASAAGGEDGMAGRELPFPLPPVATFDGRPRVAGVVPDVKYAGLDVPADAALYLPLDVTRVSTLYLAVRTAGEPAVLESVAPAVRRILREADPALPVGEIRSLEDEMASTLLDRRLRAVPAAGLAAVALAVALTGVFALLSRSVAERRRELAVRIALGASAGGILGLVLRRAAALTGAGLVLGMAGSLAVARGLDSLLFGVGSRDPLTLGAVALTVAVAGLLAAWIPARRAARVEPLELLRSE